MNLTLSGDIDESLQDVLARMTSARSIVSLHERALRFEAVTDTPEVRAAVAAQCRSARVDHAFMHERATLSEYRVLAMDMDSTLITIECIDELADLAGKKTEVAAITEAAMRGEIADFAESLRRRVALLAGTPAALLERVYAERLKLSPGAEVLLSAARRAGLATLLVSGGFTFFAARLQRRLGFDQARANVLEIEGDRLTGRVVGGIIDASGKACAVDDLLAERGASKARSIVIGDGANDLAMMAGAGLSIAFHAKPIVRAATSQAIDFGGLDVLLDWMADAPNVPERESG